MSRLLRLFGFWSLCLGLILGPALVLPAVAEPTRNPIPAQVSQIDGYPFPTRIAGLSRGHKTDYHTPGLGFSVRYESPGETWADIFVYDLGQDVASSDPRQGALDQCEVALGDIQTAVSAGSYQKAIVLSKGETGPFAKAHLTVTQRGTTRDSYVFVTVSRNNFVKIRYTTSSPDSDRIAERFAEEYGRLLSD